MVVAILELTMPLVGTDGQILMDLNRTFGHSHLLKNKFWWS